MSRANLHKSSSVGLVSQRSCDRSEAKSRQPAKGEISKQIIAALRRNCFQRTLWRNKYTDNHCTSSIQPPNTCVYTIRVLTRMYPPQFLREGCSRLRSKNKEDTIASNMNKL